MKNSESNPGWYARFHRAGKRVNMLPRGLLVAAMFVAAFTVYHISRVDSTADQAVARAQQEAEQSTVTATAEATPADARQAVKGTPQARGPMRGEVRSDSALPAADADIAQSFTVDDARVYVYNVRMGEYWSLVADRFDMTAELLKEANVELWQLRGEDIRPGDQLAIPGLKADATVPPILYEVQVNDSWEQVAEEFSVSYLDLLLDNFNLWALRGVDIRAGDEITVRYLPPELTEVGAARGWSDGPPVFAPSYAAARDQKAASEAASNSAGTYTVQPGDTWEAVAAATGINVEALKEVNGEISEQALRPGDILRISWLLHVALMIRQSERRGVRSATDLGNLSEEELATLAARGQSVYKEQYCGICHQLDSAGTRGMFGPPHNDMGELAAARLEDPAYDGAATDVYAYLYESIIEPAIFYVEGFALSPHRMPSYQHIPEGDLEALIVFLADQ